MKNETEGKILDCIELLLQVIELFPDARKHVEQYVTHGDIHELQLELKGEDDALCGACNGSGEGMYDGSSCGSCCGTGVHGERERREREREEKAEMDRDICER